MWNAAVNLIKSFRSLKIVLFAYAIFYVLFLENKYVEDLISQLPIKYKLVFEITGLFCSVLSVALIIEHLFKKVNHFWLESKRPKVLKFLTPIEKEILRRYIFDNRRTHFFRYSSGEINHLVAIQVIYRASTISKMGDVFAYNIQPWALEYLSKNRHLIEGKRIDITDIKDPYEDY